MTLGRRIFFQTALALSISVPAAWAQQKPSGPAPPSSPAPTRSANPMAPVSSSSQPDQDFVVFLQGHIATEDGSPVPHDVLIERVCNERVRQEVYAAPGGDFSMELGQRPDSLQASPDGISPYGQLNATQSAQINGIPRRELATCELRTTASGFFPRTVSLMELTTVPGNSSIDVGKVVVHRAGKPEGTTLSATPYKAPPNARKAYERGLQAEKNTKFADAQKDFEKAVELYPRFASAWFHLGSVLQQQNQTDAARSAYTRATSVDARFMPPYLSLAAMAFEAEHWSEVLTFTHHILELDPLNRTNVTGYVLDLDPVNYADAYVYDAFANYKLHNLEEAEKSGVKAEHVNLRSRYPQLHLMLADIFTLKHNYAGAISECQTYLELAPQAENVAMVRQHLAKLEELNSSAPPASTPEPN